MIQTREGFNVLMHKNNLKCLKKITKVGCLSCKYGNIHLFKYLGIE